MGVVSARPLQLLGAWKGEVIARLHCALRNNGIARETGFNRILDRMFVVMEVWRRANGNIHMRVSADVRSIALEISADHVRDDDVRRDVSIFPGSYT